MPPKFKFTKEEILQTAFNLVRKNGWNTLSTRTIATELGSSARPIYSFFKSMEDLEEDLIKLSVDLLYTHMQRNITNDPWIDHGIGYVMFAQEEKHLFRGCNYEKNITRFRAHGDIVWNKCTASLSDYPPFNGLTREQIQQVQLTRWLMTHGLSYQVSSHPPDVWDKDQIVLVVQNGSIAVLDGLKKQFGLD